MSSLEASNIRRSALHNKLALVNLRKNEVDLQAQVDGMVEQQVGDLQKRATEIAEVLLPRLEESKQQIADLTEKTIEVLSDNNLIEANEIKTQQLEALRAIKQNLFDALPALQQSLEEDKKDKAFLTQQLEELKKRLKHSSPIHCAGAIHQVGERGSYRIANGRNPPPSRDTRNKEYYVDQLTWK